MVFMRKKADMGLFIPDTFIMQDHVGIIPAFFFKGVRIYRKYSQVCVYYPKIGAIPINDRAKRFLSVILIKAMWVSMAVS